MNQPTLSNDRITLTWQQPGVAHVRMARADKMNALDPAMIDALLEVGALLAGADGLRCVVLAGEGRAFCAGLDLGSIAGGFVAGDAILERSHGISNRWQQMAMQWRDLPVPVIAAVHGVCFGGGLQIAAGADIRIAATDTRMAVMEMKWGIVPDMGHFALWRGLVREDHLRELTFSNREFPAEEALRLGFVTEISADPLARATALAEDIASKNPDAIRAAKRLFATRGNTADILLAESQEQARLIGSANQMEAVMAAMAGREANYNLA